MFITAIICVFLIVSLLVAFVLEHYTAWSLSSWGEGIVLLLISAAITFLMVYYGVI